MWSCPKCGRPFKREGQGHSCVQIEEYALFERSSIEVLALYEILKDRIEHLQPFFIHPVEKAILFKNRANFLSVGTRKEGITVTFYLDRYEELPRVRSHLQNSAKRIAHQVYVFEPGEIDLQLIRWIEESYRLLNK